MKSGTQYMKKAENTNEEIEQQRIKQILEVENTISEWKN